MLSERFTEALNYATHLHANQTRKCSGVPYIAYLLGVTSIVWLQDWNSWYLNKMSSQKCKIHEPVQVGFIC